MRSRRLLHSVLLILVIFIFSSCALLLNKKTTKIELFSEKSYHVVVQYDTLKIDSCGTKIRTLRSDKPLAVEVINDSTTKHIFINPVASSAYLADFFCGSLVSAYIDMQSKKRFDYPKYVLLTPENIEKPYRRYWNYDRTGDINLNIYSPCLNFYSFNPKNSIQNFTDKFMGINLGIDVYYTSKQFLNLSVGVTGGSLKPKNQYFDMDNWALCKYATLSNNHKIRRFSVGYGICVAKNDWMYYDGILAKEEFYIENTNDIVKNIYAFGFVFPSYFQLGPIFEVGLVYRPSLFLLSEALNFRYEHVISIDFAWKFNIYRK